MSLTYNPAYNTLSQSLGPYVAAMQIAKEAREIVHSLGNRITDSEAISFAARGELPDPKNYPDHRLYRVKNYVVYIEDIEVRSAVVASYEESLRKDNLVYEYMSVGDEPRKAKIRIIMNILWDKRPHKKT